MNGTRRDHPAVSVVVASNRERASLDACLASLLPQCQRAGIELVVARASSEAELEQLRVAYPTIVFVIAPPSSAVPRLRAIGMAAASGDIIALTEDDHVAQDTWVDTLLAHSPNATSASDAAAAARRNDNIDWAAYFAENGFFPQPGREKR